MQFSPELSARFVPKIKYVRAFNKMVNKFEVERVFDVACEGLIHLPFAKC